MIRCATPVDARAIATIHVEAWRAAYRGIVPDKYLDSLSIDGREAAWRQNLLAAEASTWAHKNLMPLLGGSQRDRSRDKDAGASTGEIWAVYVAPDVGGKAPAGHCAGRPSNIPGRKASSR